MRPWECPHAVGPHFGSKKSNFGSIWVHFLTVPYRDHILWVSAWRGVPILGPKSAILGQYGVCLLPFPIWTSRYGCSHGLGSPFWAQNVQFWVHLLSFPPPYETLGVSPCCGSPFWVQKVPFWVNMGPFSDCSLYRPHPMGVPMVWGPHFGSKKCNFGSVCCHFPPI